MSIAGSANHLDVFATFATHKEINFFFFFFSTKASTEFHPLSTSRVFLGRRIVFLAVGKVCESELYSENGKPEKEAT